MYANSNFGCHCEEGALPDEAISNGTASKLHRIWVAAIALAIVETFELTNGFGVMTSVYDPFDYLANGLGVALAICVDIALDRITQAVAK